MYGGTGRKQNGIKAEAGLSPRVRGNRVLSACVQVKGRSIPACTGEPASSPLLYRGRAVYPRVYGGTQSCNVQTRTGWGLSPRVRGNQVPGRERYLQERSIPACTGEPPPVPQEPIEREVYPRVYGGTYRASLFSFLIQGLSPRVRGNHHKHQEQNRPHRSIPACTGEPAPPIPGGALARVYPRVYGGTRIGVGVMLTDEGLSPRVRGNLRIACS